jgi:galactitol PTS system EIIB component
MSPTPKILVACSTAMATSTLIARTIEETLAKRGIQVVTHQCKVHELPALAGQDYTLVVSTTIIHERLPIPVVSGMPFLCGNDQQQVINEIAAILTNPKGS